MKTLTTMLPLSAVLGALVAALALVLRVGVEDRDAWLLGALVSTGVGALTLVLKTQLAVPGLTGAAALKALLAAQGLSFLVRLMAVGVGAVAVKQNGLPYVPFVISFFVVSLAQQVLETRSLLAARNPVKSSEVPS